MLLWVELQPTPLLPLVFTALAAVVLVVVATMHRLALGLTARAI